jgi:ribosomal protein S18 acetylase RimI-like enzyme
MKISIVEYDQTNKHHFESLNREWIEKYFEVEPADLAIFSDPETHVLNNGGEIFFAKVGGEILGTCSLFKRKTGYELARMAVTEAAQGKGIGTILIQECLRRARDRKVDKIFLVTNSKLQSAIHLYKKSGFMIVHTGKVAGYKRADTIMELKL